VPEAVATPDPRAEQLGTVFGLVAYGIWGLFPLYFPLLEPASPLEVLGHRIIWSFLAVAVALTVLRRWSILAVLRMTPRLAGLSVVAGLLIAINWGVYIWAVNSDHVVEAALGYFVNPLVTVALGVVVLGERLRRGQVAALVIAVAAVAVLTVGYGRVPLVALVLACTFASYSLVKKVLPLDALSSLAVETAALTPAALVLLVALGAGGDTVFGLEHPDTSLMLATTGVVTITPLLLFGAAARRVPLSLLGLMQYVTPVGQFLCGVLVFHEQVSALRWAGFVLVWTALVILTVDALRARRPLPPVAEPEAVPAKMGA